MEIFNSISKIIFQGYMGFRRQGSFNIASIFILSLVIFLFTFLFVFYGMAQSLSLNLQERIDISVYFDSDSSEKQVLEAKSELSKFAEVKSVEYVSAEEALNKFTEKYQNNSIIMSSLEEIGGNPLLASLNIQAFEAGQYASISNFLISGSFEDIIYKINYSEKKPVIERFFSLISGVNKAGIIFGIVLILVAISIAFNQIRLAIRNSRKEIKIMRLVGATNFMIRGPFFVQGVLIGIFAVLLTLLIFVPVSYFLSPRLEMALSGFEIFGHFADNFFFIFSSQIAIGVGISTFSSLIAVHKYLKI